MKKKSLIIIGLILTLAVIAGGFWYWGNRKEQSVKNQEDRKTDQTKQKNSESQEQFDAEDVNKWKIYMNEEIGVRFDYPAKWGEIKEWREEGCFEYNKDGDLEEVYPSEKDKCSQIALFATNFKDSLFFSTQTPLKSRYGAPRGGWWGDEAYLVKSENDVKNFCKDKPKNQCSVFKTKNNLLVVKNIERRPFFSPEDKIVVYYMKSTHPIYFSIVMSFEKFEYENVEDDFDKVIGSLIFLQ